MKKSELVVGRVYAINHWSERKGYRYAVFTGTVEVPSQQRYSKKTITKANVTLISRDGELSEKYGQETLALSAIQFEQVESFEQYKLQRAISDAKAELAKAERAKLQFELVNLVDNALGNTKADRDYDHRVDIEAGASRTRITLATEDWHRILKAVAQVNA